MIRAHGKELPRHPPRSHRPRPQSHAHADPVSRACPSRSLVSIQSPIENHKSSHKGIPPILPNMKMLSKVQPKYLIVAGAVIVALSMYGMTNVYGDLGFWYMARLRMLFGIGLPLIFVPIMTASFDGIHPSKTDQASALINAARNTGSSIGVSIVSNVLTHREQFHQSRLVEQVIPSRPTYQDTLP